MSRVHRLVLELVFPEGLHPGAGKDLNNRLMIARDGHDRPVLRGSALAGALRQAYKATDRRDDDLHFGERSSGTDGGTPSPLQVADVVLDCGKSKEYTRHHNGIDRHFGVVRDKSLFDLEALPPGSTGTAVLVYRDPSDTGTDAYDVLMVLTQCLMARMTLGGNSARGLGTVMLEGEGRYQCFNLKDLDEHAAWLDEQYAWRQGATPAGGQTFKPVTQASDHVLQIDLTLAIPRGQDLLVADGQGVDHEMEPQRITHANGDDCWRLPGSALRGVLRAWMSRLAAREDCVVDDRVERIAESTEQKKRDGHAIAWGFDNRESIIEMVPDCPIMNLFGSAVKKGRIHISDGYCEALPEHEQVRMHVAVDRITGGANDGFLFDNTVLCGNVAFPIRIRVSDPQEREARWLAQSLTALDLGLIRVGSSKAVGSVRVRGLSASGLHHEQFEDLAGKEATS